MRHRRERRQAGSLPALRGQVRVRRGSHVRRRHGEAGSAAGRARSDAKPICSSRSCWGSRPGPEATESEAEFMSVGRWTGPGREPFYGDEPDERWKVVARPGSRIADDLRDDDLVVYRSFKFRGLGVARDSRCRSGQRFTLPRGDRSAPGRRRHPPSCPRTSGAGDAGESATRQGRARRGRQRIRRHRPRRCAHATWR